MKRNSWRIYGDSSYVTGRRFGSRLPYARQTIDALIQGILAYNPIAYWPLNDAAGSTTARDVTGNGFTGQVSGAVNFGATGLTLYGENAAQFTSGSKLAIPKFPALENLSVIYLVNYSSAGYSQHLLSGNASTNGFIISESNSGPTVYAQTFPNGTAGTNVALAINTTGMVAYTNNGFTGAMSINNGTVVEKSQPLNPVQGLIIGQPSVTTTMAHVAIFNDVLTPAQITAIYQLITATPTLVPFNGTDASVGVFNPNNLGVIMGAGTTQGDCFWIQNNLPLNSTRVANGSGLIVNGEMLIVADGTYGVMPLPPQSRLVPLGGSVAG